MHKASRQKTTANKPSTAIIGKGKVGSALTQLMELTQTPVTLVGRSQASQLVALNNADIVLICVNDDSIKDVCEQLAPILKSGTVVSHCSASLDSSVLIAAQNAGCYVASTHPLNTFPSIEAALTTFSNTAHQSHLYAEGDTQALTPLLTLFSSLGFNTNIIERKAKPLYHVACVFACNYLNSLMELSMRSAEAAGLDRGVFWSAIQPIIYRTLKNIDNLGTEKSLSGPIARGDLGTVSSHLNALSVLPSDIKLSYADLGMHALSLAIERGELKQTEIAKMKDLLSKN